MLVLKLVMLLPVRGSLSLLKFTSTATDIRSVGHAQKTGAGVGPLGENLGSGRAGVGAGDNYSSSGAGVGTGFAAGAGLGAAGGLAESDYERYGQEAGITRGPGAQKTVAGSGAVAGQQGEALGVGGGLGGQLPGQNYSSGQYSTTDYSSGNQGAGYDTGAVAASAGLGAAGMTSGRDQGGRDQGDSGGGNAGGDSGNQGDKQGGDRGGRQGHYGAVSDDANRGGESVSSFQVAGADLRLAPLSKAEDIDSGGPHSLVFQESTGRYVHRRDL